MRGETKVVTLKELNQLKHWLDSELTILHIMFAVVLGVQVGGKFWWFVGVYTALNVMYIFKRLLTLPRNYLTVTSEQFLTAEARKESK